MTSDQIMNLLEEVAGRRPEDKPGMLAVTRACQKLPDADRLVYPVGRRGDAFRSTRDPAACRKIRQMIAEVERREGPEAVERMITDMVDQYI